MKLRAERIYGELSEEGRASMRRVLERMVAVEAGEFSRRRVVRWELEAPGEAERETVALVLGKLDEARMIVADAQGGEEYLELAHDALITGWDRFHSWLREDARRIASSRLLSQDARQWDLAPKAQIGLLWADAARRSVIEQLIHAQAPGLNAIEGRFAEASLARVKRNKRFRALVMTLLAATTIGALLLADQTRRQRDEARATAFSLQSDSERTVSPLRALNLGLKAYDTKPTEAAVLAIRRAIDDVSLLASRPASRPYAMSADGSALAYLGPDQRLHVANSETLSDLWSRPLQLHQQGFAFDYAGKTLAGTNASNVVALWDTQSGRRRDIRFQHEIRDAIPSRSGKYLAVATYDDVEIRDLHTTRLISRVPVQGYQFNSIAFGPDDKFVVICQGDKAIVLEVASGKRFPDLNLVSQTREAKRQLLEMGSQSEASLLDRASFGTDPNLVFTVGFHSLWRLWDMRTGKELAGAGNPTPGAGTNWALATPDGKHVITSFGSRGEGAIWDMGQSWINLTPGHTNLINGMALSPDGRRILTVGADREGIVWDTSTGRRLSSLYDDEPSMNDVSFTPSGGRIVTTSVAGRIALWDLSATSISAPLPGSEWEIAQFNKDATRLVASAIPNTQLIERSGVRFTSVANVSPSDPLTGVAISGDGKLLLGLDDAIGAVLFDGETMKRRWTIPGHYQFGTFSASGRLIGLSDYNGNALVAETSSGKVLSRGRIDQDLTNALVFSADETRYALTGNDGSVAIASVRTGKLLQKIPVSSRSVRRAIFLDHDSRLAVTADDLSVQLLPLASPRNALRLVGHTQAVSKILSASNDDILISLGDDGLIKIWDSRSGQLVRTIAGHGAAVLDARLVGDTLISIDRKGLILQNRCFACQPTSTLVQRARGMVDAIHAPAQ